MKAATLSQSFPRLRESRRRLSRSNLRQLVFRQPAALQRLYIEVVDVQGSAGLVCVGDRQHAAKGSGAFAMKLGAYRFTPRASTSVAAQASAHA